MLLLLWNTGVVTCGVYQFSVNINDGVWAFLALAFPFSKVGNSGRVSGRHE